MRQPTKITPYTNEERISDQIESTIRFTGIGVNVVVIAMAVVAIVPLLFSTRFWALPSWQIGLVLLCWLVYTVNGTGGMMLHERFLNVPLVPYLYFGIQFAAIAGLLFLTRDTGSGSVWILILPIAAQSLSRGWLFTAVVSLGLLGLIWRAYFPDQPFLETIIDLLSISAAMVFTLIFTSIAVRESSARNEVQRLATDLRQANHRLAEYAAQVEDLATMRERNRVAREIHDNLGHYLTVVNVQIEAAKTIMTQNPEKAQDALDKAQNLTQEGLTAVRHSVNALRESPLENQSLAEALEQLAEAARETGLVVDLQIQGEPTTRDPKVALTLYRAVQEGFTNVRKHARASRVDVLLQYAPAETVLTMQDNGIGTDLTTKPTSSFGLIGIKERVQLLNGRMHIKTAPQQGFQFSITLPKTS
ncbi:sensor histidine kinase [Candidatus Leptofilum sp.]|uniref:sensor histidine kinase n=1 Tax=Candidatus Leptofilum sp. TaxID=3241576 RepID=UPI003B593686